MKISSPPPYIQGGGEDIQGGGEDILVGEDIFTPRGEDIQGSASSSSPLGVKIYRGEAGLSHRDSLIFKMCIVFINSVLNASIFLTYILTHTNTSGKIRPVYLRDVSLVS